MKVGKHDAKRAIAVVTSTTAGEAFKPMVIFKRTRNSCIVKYEFSSYIVGLLSECQENAWMDEVCMLQWVNNILKPYVETAFLGIISVLLLDS